MHGLKSWRLVEQQTADEHDITYSSTVMRVDGTRAESVNTSVIATTGDGKKFRIITLLRSIAGGSSATDSAAKVSVESSWSVSMACARHWEIAGRRWQSG